MADLVEISARFGAAVLCGGIIGLNRVLNGKPAGVRLHALVSLSCALLVYAGGQMPGDGSASRVAQGILAGLGFLGAGVILRQVGPDNGHSIHHLTTAATIWSAAALGVACGVGLYAEAAIATATMLILLVAAIRIDRLFFRRFGDESDRGGPIS